MIDYKIVKIVDLLFIFRLVPFAELIVSKSFPFTAYNDS